MQISSSAFTQVDVSSGVKGHSLREYKMYFFSVDLLTHEYYTPRWLCLSNQNRTCGNQFPRPSGKEKNRVVAWLMTLYLLLQTSIQAGFECPCNLFKSLPRVNRHKPVSKQWLTYRGNIVITSHVIVCSELGPSLIVKLWELSELCYGNIGFTIGLEDYCTMKVRLV